MRLLTPTIKIDISKRGFLKMISKMEVSISQWALQMLKEILILDMISEIMFQFPK